MPTLISNKRKGIIATVLFHLAAILALLLVSFERPEKITEESAILVFDFGASGDEKGGSAPELAKTTAQTQKIMNPVTLTTKKSVPKTSSPKNAKEEVITQNQEKTVAIESSPEKQTVKPVQDDIPEKIPEIDAKKLFRNKKQTGNENPNEKNPGSNENKGQAKGYEKGIADSGINKGTKDGPGIADGIKGPATGYIMKNRIAEELPLPSYTSREQGKVMVEIKVDRAGKVVSAIPGIKGTTTSDHELWTAAKNAAMKARFNEKEDASEFQIGTISYSFILQ